MALVRVAAPDPIVSLDEAKAHLRLDSSDEDAYVSALVEVATSWIDGANGWLGRALGVQQWDLKLDAVWWCRNVPLGRSQWWDWTGYPYNWRLRLPLPPLRSVDSVKYLDANGALQTYGPANYTVAGVGADWGGAIFLNTGAIWPAVKYGPEALTIRFSAGYDDPPSAAKHAILLMVGHLYTNREEVSVGGVPQRLPMGVDALLMPLRFSLP